MKNLLLKILSISLLCQFATTAQAEKTYKPEWDSLVNYKAPEWYEDAKIGFWAIWGVYSVPAFKGDHAAEWYGRWMYCQKGQSSRNDQGYATYVHHLQKYGKPDEFGYKDLIPLFKGENFNADEWADLCIEGGAKFFTMIGVFSDNFIMWDSDVSKWNSADMGPKRDVVGELSKAVRKKGLKFGVSNHSGWNYAFYQWNHVNGFDAKDKANIDLYGSPIINESVYKARIKDGEDRRSFLKRSRGNDVLKPSQRDLDKWLLRATEVVDLYQPDLCYFDWGINIPEFEPNRRIFASHYYNKALELGKIVDGKPNVVINYKGWNTFKRGSGVEDFERGGMDKISDLVWQTDDCIYAGHNWGYVEDEPIKDTNIIVDELMDVISKRGVLMLAMTPKGDGSFPKSQKKFIKELGDWLKICGEAVYCTRPYKVMGELSESWGAFTYGKIYIGQKEDIRYTRTKDNKTLYATFLAWNDGEVTIKTLADLDADSIKSISLVGGESNLKWKQTKEGLKITMPKRPNYKYAYPIKIEYNKPLN